MNKSLPYVTADQLASLFDQSFAELREQIRQQTGIFEPTSLAQDDIGVINCGVTFLTDLYAKFGARHIIAKPSFILLVAVATEQSWHMHWQGPEFSGISGENPEIKLRLGFFRNTLDIGQSTPLTCEGRLTTDLFPNIREIASVLPA